MVGSPWIPISLAAAGFVLGLLVTAERNDGAIAKKALDELEARGRVVGSAAERDR